MGPFQFIIVLFVGGGLAYFNASNDNELIRNFAILLVLWALNWRSDTVIAVKKP